jgi:hypothetical protein
MYSVARNNKSVSAMATSGLMWSHLPKRGVVLHEIYLRQWEMSNVPSVYLLIQPLTETYKIICIMSIHSGIDLH